MIFLFLGKHLANDYIFCDRIFPNCFLPFNVKEEKAASALVYEMNDPLISLSKEDPPKHKGRYRLLHHRWLLADKKTAADFLCSCCLYFLTSPITEKHWGGSVHLWDKA